MHGEAFDDIEAIKFSPDSRRYVYQARLEDKWFIILDGFCISEACDKIWWPRFTKRSKYLEYAYRLGNKVYFRRQKI